jgi:hypothetical protein
MNVNLINNRSWKEHRSGWAYVIRLFEMYQNSNGILLDGCIDATFGYESIPFNESSPTPKVYNKDWIGFLHHPINICPWYRQEYLSPKYVLQSHTFQESLPFCRGIITLSSHLAQYVKSTISEAVPTISILHPTENSNIFFDLGRFKRKKNVLHIGSWMRKITSFYRLEIPKFTKYMPVSSNTLNCLKNESEYYNNLTEKNHNSVIPLNYLPNRVYDKLLSESVVFIDLYDASANNAIIECIMRNTPIVVNKIPPVVEYLGNDYPLYFNDIEEAQEIIKDMTLIEKGYLYISNCINKEKFTGQEFINNIKATNLL